MRRLALVLVLSIAGATALAQQPVTSPIYYLSSAPVLEVGGVVSGVLTRESGRNFKDGSYLDVLVLHGLAGDAIVVRATSRDFDTYLTLFDPEGSIVDLNDDDLEGGGTDAAIRTTLPVSGRYLVVISGYGSSDLGAYDVTLDRGAVALPTAPLTVPSSVQATLREGGTVSYALDLTEATVVGFDLRSGAFDTVLAIVDAFGVVIAENDDAPGGTDSSLVAVLEPGSYEVRVSAYGAAGGGDFELSLVRYVPSR
jgi:hypothetical protein